MLCWSLLATIAAMLSAQLLFLLHLFSPPPHPTPLPFSSACSSLYYYYYCYYYNYYHHLQHVLPKEHTTDTLNNWSFEYYVPP
jgi:hypothetical protein